MSNILALGNETQRKVEALRDKLEGITITQVKMGKEKIARCTFCQVDDHRLAECQDKFECIKCSKNCHKVGDCPFREDYKCRWSNAALLHHAVDPAFRH